MSSAVEIAFQPARIHPASINHPSRLKLAEIRYWFTLPLQALSPFFSHVALVLREHYPSRLSPPVFRPPQPAPPPPPLTRSNPSGRGCRSPRRPPSARRGSR